MGDRMENPQARRRLRNLNPSQARPCTRLAGPMSNDELPGDEKIPNDKTRTGYLNCPFGFQALGLRHSLIIRNFVLVPCSKSSSDIGQENLRHEPPRMNAKTDFQKGGANLPVCRDAQQGVVHLFGSLFWKTVSLSHGPPRELPS